MPPIPPDQQSPYGGEAPTASAPELIELWERATVLKFFGGDKRLDRSAAEVEGMACDLGWIKSTCGPIGVSRKCTYRDRNRGCFPYGNFSERG